MKIFRSTIGYTLLVTLLNVIAGWLTARTLGPTDRGALAAILLWPNLLYSLASFGLFESLVYFFPKEHTNRRNVGITSGVMLLGLSLLVTAGAVVVIPKTLSHYGGTTQLLAGLYCLTIPLSTVAMTGNSLLLATMRIPWLNRLRLVSALVTFAGTIGLVAFRKGSVAAFVLLSAASSILLLALAWKPFLPARWRGHFSRQLAKALLAYGARSYAAVLCNLANARLDQALIAVALSPAYLGWYVVSVSISALTSLVPNAINTVVFPLTVRSSREETREALVVYLWLGIGLSALVCVGTMLICPLALHYLYGPKFSESVRPAQILALGSIALSAATLLGYSCRALGEPGKAAMSEFVGLAVTLATLPVLLWKWQIVGAAVASLLSYCATAAYLSMTIRRILELRLTDVFLLTRESRVAFFTSARAILERVDRQINAG